MVYVDVVVKKVLHFWVLFQMDHLAHRTSTVLRNHAAKLVGYKTMLNSSTFVLVH
jgi:hypothetical protein